MNLASTIKAMAAAGMSADQIADVVGRVEEERMAKARAGNARRQQALRDRRNENNAVIPVTRNADNSVTAVTGVTEERPHTPKEIPPLPSPPKGGSVRPPRGGPNDPKTILAEVLPVEVAADVMAHRKALRSPLTATAARGLAKQFADTDDPAGAAQRMMTNGWRYYRPDWDNEGRQARAGPGAKTSKPNGYYAGSLTRQPELTDVLDCNTARPSNGYAESDVDREHGRGPTLEASASSGRGGEVFHIEGFGPNAGGHRRTG